MSFYVLENSNTILMALHHLSGSLAFINFPIVSPILFVQHFIIISYTVKHS